MIYNMTTYIPSAVFNGIRVQAIHSKGYKYACKIVEITGKSYNIGGFNTIKESQSYFAEHDNIKKMVVYYYQRKKGTFKLGASYER